MIASHDIQHEGNHVMSMSKLMIFLAVGASCFFAAPKPKILSFNSSNLSSELWRFSLHFCAKTPAFILTLLFSLSSFASASEENSYLTQRHYYEAGDLKKSLEFLIGREIGEADRIVKSRAGDDSCFYEIEDTDNIVVCEHRESPDSCKCNIWHWFIVFKLHNGLINSVDVRRDLNGIDLVKNISPKQISNFRFRHYDQRTIAVLALLKKHPIGTSPKGLFKTLEESGAFLRNVTSSQKDDVYYYYRGRKIYDLDGWHVRVLVINNAIQQINISRDKRIL